MTVEIRFTCVAGCLQSDVFGYNLGGPATILQNLSHLYAWTDDGKSLDVYSDSWLEKFKIQSELVEECSY